MGFDEWIWIEITWIEVADGSEKKRMEKDGKGWRRME